LVTIADVETKYAANSIHYYGTQEREHYEGITLAEYVVTKLTKKLREKVTIFLYVDG